MQEREIQRCRRGVARRKSTGECDASVQDRLMQERRRGLINRIGEDGKSAEEGDARVPESMVQGCKRGG